VVLYLVVAEREGRRKAQEREEERGERGGRERGSRERGWQHWIKGR
jgi:hypothetical protein